MNDLVIGGIYRHYKGDLYQLDAIALHTETAERMVVYHSIHSGIAYVRPANMWSEEISLDSERLTRFEFLGDQVSDRWSKLK